MYYEDYDVRGYNLYYLSNRKNITNLNFNSKHNIDYALSAYIGDFKINASRDPRTDLECVSYDTRYHDLWDSETGIKVILYYKGRSKQEWIYEGSYRDDYDISTYEQIEHELAKMNHFGLQDYDRFETTATGGFSFSMINDVLNLADVQIIAMIAQIRNIDDMDRQWYGDDSWDVDYFEDEED